MFGIRNIVISLLYHVFLDRKTTPLYKLRGFSAFFLTKLSIPRPERSRKKGGGPICENCPNKLLPIHWDFCEMTTHLLLFPPEK